MSEPADLPSPPPLDPFDFPELGRLLTARAVAHRLSGKPGLPIELLMAADLLHCLREPDVMAYGSREYGDGSNDSDSSDCSATDDRNIEQDALAAARPRYTFKERFFHFKRLTNETLFPRRP